MPSSPAGAGDYAGRAQRCAEVLLAAGWDVTVKHYGPVGEEDPLDRYYVTVTLDGGCTVYAQYHQRAEFGNRPSGTLRPPYGKDDSVPPRYEEAMQAFQRAQEEVGSDG